MRFQLFSCCVCEALCGCTGVSAARFLTAYWRPLALCTRGGTQIWRIDQKAAEEAARALEAERKREEARAAEEASRRAREAAAERNAQVAEQQREEARLAAEILKEQREKEKELNVLRKEKVVRPFLSPRLWRPLCPRA